MSVWEHWGEWEWSSRSYVWDKARRSALLQNGVPVDVGQAGQVLDVGHAGEAALGVFGEELVGGGGHCNDWHLIDKWGLMGSRTDKCTESGRVVLPIKKEKHERQHTHLPRVKTNLTGVHTRRWEMEGKPLHTQNHMAVIRQTGAQPAWKCHVHGALQSWRGRKPSSVALSVYVGF